MAKRNVSLICYELHEATTAQRPCGERGRLYFSLQRLFRRPDVTSRYVETTGRSTDTTSPVTVREDNHETDTS